jgi:hypothetical protein
MIEARPAGPAGGQVDGVAQAFQVGCVLILIILAHRGVSGDGGQNQVMAGQQFGDTAAFPGIQCVQVGRPGSA